MRNDTTPEEQAQPETPENEGVDTAPEQPETGSDEDTANATDKE